MKNDKKSGVKQTNTPVDTEVVHQMLQRERDRLQLLQQIAAAANEAETIEEAFQTALDVICEYTKWPLAHVFMPKVLEDDSVVLASSGIWFCDDCEGSETFAFFQKITAKTSFTPGQGWLGRVFANGVPAWSINVWEEPDYIRNPQLRDLNVQAAFAFPVLTGDEVVAVMEFYATAAMEPDEELLQIMANIGTQLGRVVEREQAAQQISRSTEKLRQRELLLAEAQSLAHMGSWELDRTTQTFTLTAQLSKLAGLDTNPADLTLEDFLALIHRDDREMVAASLKNGLRQMKPWNIYPRVVRPDGKIRYLHIRNKPLPNENGRLQRIIGVAQDITEQRELEIGLERSLMFLADAQRLAQLGNWEFDLETRKGIYSDQVYRMHGLDPDKDTLTQEVLFQMEHPDDREATWRHLQLVQEIKQPCTVQYRTVLADGEIRHMETYIEPILAATGKVSGLRGTIQDVTERKNAEEKIQQQLQRLALLQKIGQTVVSTLDLDSVMNRTLERLRPLLKAEGVFVLLREDEHTLYFAAADHIGDGDLTNVRVPIEEGVAGMVVRSGEPQWLIGDQAQQHILEQIKQVAPYITRSIICVPLTLQQRVIGVIEACHSQTDAFIGEDVMTLITASSWIAIAIENARLYGELAAGQRRIRELADELVWSQEEEHRRVSYELHDHVGQGMIALEIQLELLQSDIEDEALHARLQEARELIGEVTQHTRELAYSLRPPELDTIGLHAALADLCQMFEKRVNLSIHFIGQPLPRPVPDTVGLSFYRFLQEALNNVVKHAGATRVEATLTYSDETIQLRVSDNGRGFNWPQQTNNAAGLGLLGMRERFATLNGSIQIKSTKDLGTEVIAIVPW